ASECTTACKEISDCGVVLRLWRGPQVVAWSPDHATGPDRRSPRLDRDGRPPVRRRGTVGRPCPNEVGRPCPNGVGRPCPNGVGRPCPNGVPLWEAWWFASAFAPSVNYT